MLNLLLDTHHAMYGYIKQWEDSGARRRISVKDKETEAINNALQNYSEGHFRSGGRGEEPVYTLHTDWELHWRVE